MTPQTCPFCGSENTSDANFCSECGGKLPDSSTRSSSSAQDHGQQSSSQTFSSDNSAGEILGYIIGAGLLLLGLIVLVVQPLSGSILFGVGLFALPAIRSSLESRTDVNLSSVAVVIIVAVGAVIGLMLLPAGVDDSTGSASAQTTVSSDPPAQTESTSTIGTTAISEPTQQSNSKNSGADSTITATESSPQPSPTSTLTPSPSPEPSSGLTVTVVEVVDGDTIDIRFPNGTVDTVRLLGVDTPEVNGQNDPAEFEGVPSTNSGEQCLATEGDDASEYADNQLTGETIRIRFDSKSDRRGSYGRLLAYVLIDGQNFNYQLVSEGYARVYDSEFEQSDRFYAAENDAQSSEIGVWRCRNIETATTTPAGTPSGDGQLVVKEVHADAKGNDHDNLDDEYVVFKNTGGSTLDIGGWTVEDEADHTYTVPKGTEVEPGETITLHTGSGSDTDTELYWGSDSAIWNNGGDTVIVTDDDGNTVIKHSYS